MQRGQVVNTYEKAIQFIKIRPHHSEELRRKLLMRKFPKNDISDALARLKTEGLLDDEGFGRSYLASLKRHKTYGYYGLKAKLMSRGLASNDCETLLSDELTLDEETEIGRKILAKERTIDKMRLAQKLSRKGFRSEVISRLLGSLGEFMV